MRAEPVAPAVRAARLDEVERLSRVLADAFRADPYYRWLFPRESDYARACQPAFAALLRRLVPSGTVLTTEGLEGAVVWYPLGWRPGLRGALRQLGQQLRTARILGGQQVRVVRRGLVELSRCRPSEPHALLAAVGSEPGRHGRGIASALLAAHFAQLDRSGELLYGFASSEALVPLYEARGCERAAPALRLPGGGPLVHPMLRRPRPTGSARHGGS